MMAEIQPFRALRYDLGRVGALQNVFAPPYDVIDEPFRKQLAERHANNIVHLDLPHVPDGGDKYANAGRMLKDWVRDGVLKQDSARSFYVYHQLFESEGKQYVRKGFFARVRLEPFSPTTIRPHEETFAGPKQDRLKLMEATGVNLSPVFGLFEDPANKVQQLLETAISRQPPIEAVDHLGVINRLWAVTDQNVISQVTGLMGPKHILIADGHHRYETCLHFRNQSLGDKANQPGDEPVRYNLMVLVSGNDPGLIVMPTHRLVQGFKCDGSELMQKLQPSFEVKVVGLGPAAADACWDQLLIDVGQGGLGFATSDGQWLVAKPKDIKCMAELAADHSEEWRHLSVSILHRLVLEPLLGIKTPPAKLGYVHRVGEVVDAQKTGQCDLGILVPPVSVAEVDRLAANGEKMTQKSTYFYPKLQTGLVINPLFSN